jgi:hypothetical protein
MGVKELANLKTENIFLRKSISGLTGEVYFKNHPFILVEENNIGSGRGQGRRLCDTKFPIDSELKKSIKNYLAIRPNSPRDQLLLSISNWGEQTTPDIIHHIVEKTARSCGLYEEGVQVGDNLTPQRLIEFFKYRFGGQPATKQYLLGRKEKMPYSWPVLQTDYREGIYTLVG